MHPISLGTPQKLCECSFQVHFELFQIEYFDNDLEGILPRTSYQSYEANKLERFPRYP